MQKFNSAYRPTPFIRTIQIILLILIIIGVGLLATEKLWVPKLVNYMLKDDPNIPLEKIDFTNTIPVARPGKIDSGVEGIVTIGPTCPVQRIPDDGTCADKPYKTTLVLASKLPGRGTGIMIKTDDKGYFSATLAPGSYTISAPLGNALPRFNPVSFEVLPHKRVSLNLQFDSGIR